MLDQFHPSVAKWFQEAFNEPSEIQQKAWPEIIKGKHTLIAAPTGSGKTLAAFYAIIDDLVKQGLEGKLEQRTQVVYVSPLKALGNDIERNLQVPLAGIQETLKADGLPEVKIKVMVRSGDTPNSERTAMVKKPPHILVTTPESLYLLLTSINGRKILSDVKTIILDEIHALLADKRGSHLALSLERLNRLTTTHLKRIGLSATQKPIETVSKFLTGNQASCTIIDIGHVRKRDLALELPASPLTAVMPNEVWTEIYQRLEALILTHQTTLIFVNTRRLAERLAHHLTEKLGKDTVMAHHGSMAKERRFEAEMRLKGGELKALVATASLELGIDIGSVDLVCQIGSPKSIATFLQRVGRSGHSLKGTPKGRLFPMTRDELVESVAILDAIRREELDEIVMPEKPLDVLAQQIVAELACEEYQEEELYDIFNNAYPYENLERKEFDQVIKTLAEGFTTRKGRSGAYIHHDTINERLRGRKNARLAALVSGGAIPDTFDFDVVMEPTGTPVGTVDEDFAIESLPGDIFKLGNNSWQILRVENGKVRVADAQGAPPTIPFWFGEAPGRSAELSIAVSRLREEVGDRMPNLEEMLIAEEGKEEAEKGQWKETPMAWLMDEVGISRVAADQLVTYLAASKAALGVMPSQNNIVMERFFDEAGDMHLVIHSPFGSRMNRAWGLSLRKRFCRKFNFELQAAATEDAIVLSLGATHSFPLEEVFNYLNPKTVRHVLVQALLDAPMFEVRWRWNATRSLAVLRRNGGKKVPPAIQRMNSEDLIALVFPDQIACLENIAGEREVPDHPLVDQTIHDCLYEVMDIETLESLLVDMKAGKKNMVARDLREASPLAHEILNARPYAFLDGAGLEERRTNAIQTRQWIDPSEAKELGKLDLEAIELVRTEAWPQVSNADELHDALVLYGFLTQKEGQYGDGEVGWEPVFDQLMDDSRALTIKVDEGKTLWIAIERLTQLKAVYPDDKAISELKVPAKLQSTVWERSQALKELVRGRLEALGPIQAAQVADEMALPVSDIDNALLDLENEGFVFRGQFTPGIQETEWCERRLLARIHRYTLQRLRKEIEPVSASIFMSFLFDWQHVGEGKQLEGPDSVLEIIKQLEGYEAAAAVWESDVLPSRIKDYDYFWLDVLCMSGRVQWGRFSVPDLTDQSDHSGSKSLSPVKSTPITLVQRANLHHWKQDKQSSPEEQITHMAQRTQKAYQVIKENGAIFFNDLAFKAGLFYGQTEEAISELVAAGLVTSDSYTGLRALLVPAKYKGDDGARKKKNVFGMDEAGRWSLLQNNEQQTPDSAELPHEFMARTLLSRYGVVFRKLVEKESFAPPWHELVRTLRTLEARGEIRGGRFVDGFWGEQFALPEAVAKLRAIRKECDTDRLVTISAADPLNLTGIITPGRRVPAYFGNRILYRNGVPVAIKEGKEIKYLTEMEEVPKDTQTKWQLRDSLIQRNISPKLRAYLGKGIM
ncbi:MAG: DEAD/DEAH box helicase [Bacteroidota bacterium]